MGTFHVSRVFKYQFQFPLSLCPTQLKHPTTHSLTWTRLCMSKLENWLNMSQLFEETFKNCPRTNYHSPKNSTSFSKIKLKFMQCGNYEFNSPKTSKLSFTSRTKYLSAILESYKLFVLYYKITLFCQISQSSWHHIESLETIIPTKGTLPSVT